MPINAIICNEELNAYNQNGFTWNQYANNEILREIQDFDEFLENGNLPELLTREHVIEYFVNNQFYEGFVAAMMWGSINATRPRPRSDGNPHTTNFYLALSLGWDEITSRMEILENLLRENEIEAAYSYMSGTGSIAGVGPSYFTKLFYFIGKALEERGEAQFDNGLPLIYDKWTKWIHIAMLRDAQLIGDNTIFELYTPNAVARINRPQIPLVSTRVNQEALAYADYNQRMYNLAHEFGLESDHMESYLFGKPMRGENLLPENNVRVRLIKYLRAPLN